MEDEEPTEIREEASQREIGLRHGRRLSDKILVAFHQSCDQGDFEVADQLLRILEMMTRRPNPPNVNRRRSIETLVAAHERLWNLRHSEYPLAAHDGLT